MPLKRVTKVAVTAAVVVASAELPPVPADVGEADVDVDGLAVLLELAGCFELPHAVTAISVRPARPIAAAG